MGAQAGGIPRGVRSWGLTRRGGAGIALGIGALAALLMPGDPDGDALLVPGDPDGGALLARPACELPGAAFVRLVPTRERWPHGCPFTGHCGVPEYTSVPDHFPGEARDDSEEDLDADLIAVAEGEVPLLPPLDDPALRDAALQRATGLDLLLLDLEHRPLEIELLQESVDGPWRGAPRAEPVLRVRQLMVTDPLVGSFEVVVYLPLGSSRGLRPLVVAHGHRDSGWVGAPATELAEELTAHGYAVLAPTFRANEGERSETGATRGLLRRGFTMMGVRIYEQILVRRVAATLPEVDPCAPVGLLGHSGGSVAGNITAHLVLGGLGFDAFVSDLTSIYHNWDQHGGGWTLDETAPALFALQRSINEVEPPIPMLRVPYDYSDGFAEVVGFLEATVGVGSTSSLILGPRGRSSVSN